MALKAMRLGDIWKDHQVTKEWALWYSSIRMFGGETPVKETDGRISEVGEKLSMFFPQVALSASQGNLLEMQFSHALRDQ